MRKRTTESTGPKISSCSRRMPARTRAKIVGSKKKPFSSPLPVGAAAAAQQVGALLSARCRRTARPSRPTRWLISGPTSVPSLRPSPSLSSRARSTRRLEQLVVNAVLKNQPARRRAALARRAERAPQHAVEREVEIRRRRTRSSRSCRPSRATAACACDRRSRPRSGPSPSIR